jgi:transcriptional regulator with XRE-family HTH domain
MVRPQLGNRASQRAGDSHLRLVSRLMKPVNPPVDLLGTRTDLPGQPRLRTTLANEDLLQRGIGPGHHVTDCTSTWCCVSSPYVTDGQLWPAAGQRYMRHVATTEPYYKRVRRLREAAGLSQPELFRRTPDAAWETVRAIEREPKSDRARYPTPKTIAAVANGLGVDPEEFPEYQLAMARHLLDERAVGLEGALEALAMFQEGQRLHAERTFGPTPDQREQAALDFEQAAEEAARQRDERSSPPREDAQAEGDQETRP